ncbi:MAG: SPOR domain-containing protein [Pseudomonadota bacterium]
MPAYYDEEEGFALAAPEQARPKVNVAALTGVAGVVALAAGGFWFLGASGDMAPSDVPVIAASEGPVKIAPENAGGELTAHTDVAAYDADNTSIAETSLGPVAGSPAEEDLPHRALGVAADAPVSGVRRKPGADLGSAGGVVPLRAALPYVQPARPSSEVESEQGIEVVALDDGQIFMPQGLSQPRITRLITSEAELLNTRRPSRLVSRQTEPVPARGEGSELAPPVSPIVRARPVELETRVAESETDDAAAEQLAALTRAAEQSQVQIQLGAYPERNKIEEEWGRLQGENTDILSGRALAVQQTISGGVTYYRLRVGPFRNPQEASTVCQALKARGYDCLLAINTERRG